MMKKVLLGCSAVVLLLVAAVGAMVVLVDWEEGGSGTAGAGGESTVAGELESAMGHRPEVAFVCRYAVVGIAPCVLDSDTGSREVAITFTGYSLPEGVLLEEQARKMAILAVETSEFANGADRTDVIFEDMISDDSSMVSRKYSFLAEDLAMDVLDNQN